MTSFFKLFFIAVDSSPLTFHRMDPEAFKKVWISILKLGLVPWAVEGIVNCIVVHYLLDMPWIWAMLFGVM